MRREFLSRKAIDRKAEEVLIRFNPNFPNNQISPKKEENRLCGYPDGPARRRRP